MKAGELGQLAFAGSFAALGVACLAAQAAENRSVRESEIAPGWARTQVNGTIFRRDPLTSFGDRQVSSFYDADGRVVLASRGLGGGPSARWRVHRTEYTGNVRDAHNVICIMFDGDGRLHVAFDHHGNPLRYAVAEAGSLHLGELRPMVGREEQRVTYPEFYPLPDGDLLFLYRDGGSGRGNLVLNRYDTATDTWSRVQDRLIDGEGRRSPYWQLHTDAQGVLHMSWVWRESPDASSNSTLCYARSRDGGVTWERSDGTEQAIPITWGNGEVAAAIPQKSDLINTTTMTADEQGRPLIATYWRPEGAPAPQYMVVRREADGWRWAPVSSRSGDFTLSGGGSLAIPIARPLVLSHGELVAVFTRDLSTGGRLEVSVSAEPFDGEWTTTPLTEQTVGYLEPSFDRRRFLETGEVHLYVQRVDQRSHEQQGDLEPQPVRVIEWQWPDLPAGDGEAAVSPAR